MLYNFGYDRDNIVQTIKSRFGHLFSVAQDRVKVTSLLSLPVLKKITPHKFYEVERKRRSMLKLDEAITISMEQTEFSLAVFTKYIQALKKPLTSANALRYLGKLQKLTALHSIYIRYVTVIWNATPVKSQKLVEFVTTRMPELCNPNASISILSMYTNTSALNMIPAKNSYILMDNYFITSYARINRIPLYQHSYYLTHSDDYTYVTTIERKSEWKISDVYFTLDKLAVLEASRLRYPAHAVNFDLVIKQLHEELERNKDLVKTTVGNSDAVCATQAINAILLNLKD